jgi:hypothetical protein
MNERIQELAEQAQQYAEYTTPQGLEWLPAFREKFAELIIQNCIDKIETYRIPVGNSASGELACEWTYAALREIRDDIKETFGIPDDRG